MTLKLFFNAITKITLGILIIALLIFVPAGTIHFLNGWLLMTFLFVPMLVAGVVMMIKCPQLLKKRLDMKEKQKEQGIVVKVSAVMFALGFATSGLDFRFGWSSVPKVVVISACIVFVVAYALYAEVIRENKYLSRTIEIQENQKVVDTGLYGVIRHPMYFATLVLFLSMPVILGSVYAFFVFLAYPFIIAKRIKYEEQFLEKQLSGYKEYKKKVKYKLLPFVW